MSQISKTHCSIACKHSCWSSATDSASRVGRLIELKVANFSHEHLGQLNTYVSWYKRHMTTKGDNPPIGLLLCKRKDNALVHYALADLPNTLFVSKYQVELPSLEQLRALLDAPVDQS